LKVTLAWTDTTASVNNNKAIINDLDLEVKALGSGIVYKPWVLNNSANIDSLKKLPLRNRDSLNTAEQVSIDLPAADTYEIKVIGSNVVNSPLPFHIAYRVDTLNTFTFLNPLHASDVNRQENQTLILSGEHLWQIPIKQAICTSVMTGVIIGSCLSNPLKSILTSTSGKYRIPILQRY
jgi:hypothetical protein